MKSAPSLSRWTPRVRSRSASENGISSAIGSPDLGEAYLSLAHEFAPVKAHRRTHPALVHWEELSTGRTETMADSSFDVVSKVDKMEADNAVNQARKEVDQRYDFKNVGASVEWSGEKVLLKANTEERVKAVLEVVESKMIKRGITLKSLDAGDPYASGKEFRIEIGLKNGIEQDAAKKINKLIRDEAPKSVKSQIQGDELRLLEEPRRPP